VDEEQLISQCINGERFRDCKYCPASPNNGGGCCFGIRHEYGDPDCKACELEKECSPIAHGVPTRDIRPPSRIIYPRRQTANSRTSRVRIQAGGRSDSPISSDPGPQPGEPLLVDKPYEPQPVQFNPNDNLAVRFLKVSSWGAVEGFFEMALNFCRKRRPE